LWGHLPIPGGFLGREIHRIFPGYFQGYSQDIPRIFPGYYQGTPRIFPGYSQGTPRIFPGYSLMRNW